MPRFILGGEFCPNEVYLDYGKLQKAQPKKHQESLQYQVSNQRYQCKTDGRTFIETKETLIYRRRTPERIFIRFRK
ncbi:MAG: hypothetical protein ACE5I5_15290 [Candidatus Heimdallarchaeota archaeon]